MSHTSPVNENLSKETGHAVLLFDGVCGLCSGCVQFVLPRDQHNRFYYAALQSDYAQSILSKYNKDPKDLDTVYVVADRNTPKERLLWKSSAVIYVCSQLGFPFKLAAAFNIVPKPFRDVMYDLVANNRYKWFGKHEMCMAPGPGDREKFLD